MNQEKIQEFQYLTEINWQIWQEVKEAIFIKNEDLDNDNKNIDKKVKSRKFFNEELKQQISFSTFPLYKNRKTQERYIKLICPASRYAEITKEIRIKINQKRETTIYNILQT